MTEAASTNNFRVLSLDVGVRNLGVAILCSTGKVTAGGEPVYSLDRLEVRDMAAHCGSAAKCKGMPKLTMARYAGQFLYDMEAEWDVPRVTDLIVEGQLRRAPLNTCLMCIIFAWFQRAQQAKQQHADAQADAQQAPDSKAGCAPMVQISAKKKLAGEEFMPKYRDRKNAAVQLLGQLIQSGRIVLPPAVHVAYCVAKKKDDMADAVLQAIAYLDEKQAPKKKRGRAKAESDTQAPGGPAKRPRAGLRDSPEARKTKTAKAEPVTAGPQPESVAQKAAGKKSAGKRTRKPKSE